MNDNNIIAELVEEASRITSVRTLKSRPREATVEVLPSGQNVRIWQDETDKAWATVKVAQADTAAIQWVVGEDQPRLRPSGEFFFLDFPPEALPSLLPRLKTLQSSHNTKCEWLEPLPKFPSWVSHQARESDCEALVSLLNFRAIEVRGGIVEVRETLESCLEPPYKLMRVPRVRFTDFAALLNHLSGLHTLPSEWIVLLDGNWLSNDQQHCLLRLCEELNLLSGNEQNARLIVHHLSGCGNGQTLVPCLKLRGNFGEQEFAGQLESLRVPATRRSLFVCAGLTANGRLESSAVNALRADANASISDGSAQATLRRQPHRTPDKQDILWAQQWRTASYPILNQRVIGHDEIKQGVLARIATWFSFANSGPLVLLFCGASGLGKNLLAEAIAEVAADLFDLSKPHYVSFNCASLISKTSIWQLTGTQKGLIGSEAPGILSGLSEGSVMTFDEIDKTTSESNFSTFLCSALEEGYRDNAGDWHSFPRAILILTANAGSDPSDERSPTRPALLSMQGREGEIRWQEQSVKIYKQTMDRLLHPALRGRIQQEFYFAPPSMNDLLKASQEGFASIRAGLEDCGLPVLFDAHAEALKLLREVNLRTGFRGLSHAIEKSRSQLVAEATDAFLNNPTTTLTSKEN